MSPHSVTLPFSRGLRGVEGMYSPKILYVLFGVQRDVSYYV